MLRRHATDRRAGRALLGARRNVLPRRAPAWNIFLAALLSGSLAGCGSSDSNSPPPAPPAAPVVAPPVAAPPAAAAPPGANAAIPGAPAAGNPTPAAPVAAPMPAVAEAAPDFPTDYDEWTDDDVRRAKEKQDARLSQLVPYLMEQSGADAEAIDLLADVLQTDDPSKSTAVQPTQVEAALGALASNRLQSARGVVTRIVRRELITALSDQQALDVVLRNWTAQDNIDLGLIDQMLFDPQSLREATPAKPANASLQPVNALELQNIAWRYAQPKLDARLRERVAVHLAKEGVSEADRKLFESTILERRADNVAAQVTLLLSRHVPVATRATLIQYALYDSAWSLDRLLNIPKDADASAPATGTFGIAGGIGAVGLPGAGAAPPSQPPAVTEEITEAKLAAHLAEHLWRADVAALLADKGTAIDNLLLGRMQVVAGFPLDEVRNFIHQASVQLGPTVVPSKYGDLTAFANLIHDPGLLLAVKAAPREQDPTVKDARLGKNKKPANPRAKPPPPPPPPPDARKSKFDWMQISESLVDVLCRRLHAAAKAEAAAAPSSADSSSGRPFSLSDPLGDTAATTPADDEPSGDEPAGDEGGAADDAATTKPADDAGEDPFGTRLEARRSPENLPVELHEKAHVVARYRANWPVDLGDRLGETSVPPLTVHYIRTEEEGLPANLLRHYKDQLKSAEVHALERGRWLDYVGEGSTPGKLRSIDVMIRAIGTPPAPVAIPGQEEKPKKKTEPMRVEILVVEIKAPDKARSGAGRRGGEASDSKREAAPAESAKE